MVKKKMSKSDPSSFSRINLSDSIDEITKKIQKAKTDSLPFPENVDALDDRPEVNNLINIFSSLSGASLKSILNQYANKNFSGFKEDLSQLITNELSIISSEMKRLLKEKRYLKSILIKGCERADEISNKNVKKIKSIIGL